jgi:hypothetical protein
LNLDSGFGFELRRGVYVDDVSASEAAAAAAAAAAVERISVGRQHGGCDGVVRFKLGGRPILSAHLNAETARSEPERPEI